MDPWASILQSVNAERVAYAALLSLAIIALLRGWIVPRSTVNDIRVDRDKRLTDLIEEKNQWRKAYEVSESAREKESETNRELLENSRTTASFIQSLRVVRGDRDEAS